MEDFWRFFSAKLVALDKGMNTDPASPIPDPVEEAIFHAASDLTESADRAAFLDRACGTDSALRARIETLLAADLRARQFLSDDPLDLSSRAKPNPVKTPVEQSTGHQIGRYKLLEKIGEGGMGVVYMAEQREPVVRKVALKIIKPGMDTRLVVARFEAERQALALMDHSNIARVLDGGVTDNSRPYFVMDLVQGVPITQFCDERNLSTHARLDLFLEVCSAIQHAHQKGIIHRDIKPTNILVTLHGDKPVPKVIDFGVAKATQQRLTDKTLFTQFQHFIGTPAYMSPEQASLSALDVDTRSDIYGLGVLLYELLTGMTPFDARELLDAGLDQMRRTILEKEPARPSTRLSALQREELTTTAKRRQTEAPKLLHQLRGDLDWIVMKCLEKDRSRRYETANGLAADIKRHLGNEPITARPPSRLYEFQKTVRRHRVGFAATAAVLLTLAGGVAVSSWQAVKAKRAERKAQGEADRANKESALARSAKDFLIRQVLGVNPYLDEVRDPNRRALIEKIDRAIGTQFTNQPRVEAELRYALGDAYSGVGDLISMTKQLERALEIRRREFGLTNSETLWALASTAEEYYKQGRRDENEKLLREGLAVVRAAPHALSSGEAEVLTVYSNRRFYEGDPAEAFSLLQEAIAVARQTADPKSWRFQNKLLWLAIYAGAAGRQEAEAMFAEQLRFREQEFGPNHPVTAQLLSAQGVFFSRIGRMDEAAAAHERAVSIFRRSFDPNNHVSSLVESRLAQIYEVRGRTEEAAKLYRSAYSRLSNNLSHYNLRTLIARIAAFFVRNQLGEDAKAVLGALSNYYEANPPTNAADFEMFLRVAAMTKDWPAAGNLCRDYFNRFANGREVCSNVASSFVLERRADEARVLYECLRVSFEATASTGLRDMEMWIEATAATQGWPAAAEVCRTNFHRLPRNPASWCDAASVLLYGGDTSGFQQVVANALTQTATTTNVSEQTRIAEIVGLAPSSLSAEQLKQCERLVRTLESEAASAPTNQPSVHCAIASVQLRINRFDDCLAHLEEELESLQSDPARARVHVLKATAFWRLRRFEEARQRFAEAEALMKPRLLDELPTREGFLNHDERTYLILRREAQALLTGKNPN